MKYRERERERGRILSSETSICICAAYLKQVRLVRKVTKRQNTGQTLGGLVGW